jgi:hypothetical protein
MKLKDDIFIREVFKPLSNMYRVKNKAEKVCSKGTSNGTIFNTNKIINIGGKIAYR